VSDYFVHESSYVDDGARIGEGTKIWHFCHISGDCEIGSLLDRAKCLRGKKREDRKSREDTKQRLDIRGRHPGRLSLLRPEHGLYQRKDSTLCLPTIHKRRLRKDIGKKKRLHRRKRHNSLRCDDRRMGLCRRRLRRHQRRATLCAGGGRSCKDHRLGL